MRKQVGTVNILEPRVYPRRPRKPDEQLTTADEFVQVDAGTWPVYRNDADGLIYWEMEGELLKIESTFESLGDGMFMARQKPTPQGQLVIFQSVAFTLDEFTTFFTTDPAVVEGPEKRLVFHVEI